MPAGGFGLGRGDLSGQRGRSGPRGCRGLVLGCRLIRQRPEPVQATAVRDVLLSVGTQLGGRSLLSGLRNQGRSGPGLPLGLMSTLRRASGPIGLLERGYYLGAAERRGEFLPQLLNAGGLPRELLTGPLRVDPTALAVGEALRGSLTVLGPSQLGAVRTDLAFAGCGLRGGNFGEPGSPPGRPAP